MTTPRVTDAMREMQLATEAASGCGVRAFWVAPDVWWRIFESPVLISGGVSLRGPHLLVVHGVPVHVDERLQPGQCFAFTSHTLLDALVTALRRLSR